jgi:hypothetical protein
VTRSPDPSPAAPTIAFPRSPAQVTLAEALSIGARYWAASWERWVLAVAAIAIAEGLVVWLFGSAVLGQAALQDILDASGTSADLSVASRAVAGPLAVGLVGLVADWFLTANAVAGLRGREVTLAWVLGAGLRVLAVAFGLAIVVFSAFLVLAMLGAIGLLAMLGALVVLLYVGIRLQFWAVGIFDGLGIEGSLRTSWALTRGAMGRVIGWLLALAGISLLVSMFEVTIDAMAPSAPVVPAVLGALAGAGFSAWSVVVIAILYESQRLRAAGVPPVAPSGFGPGWEGHVPPRPAWPVDPGSRPIAPRPPGPPADPDAPPVLPPPPPPLDRGRPG